MQHFKVAKVELTLHSFKPETRTVQEYNDLQEIVSTYFTIQRRYSSSDSEGGDSGSRWSYYCRRETAEVLMMASTHQFTITFEI